MAEFPLQFATRHIRRAFERAISRSIPKILAELITNADDSYRRLEEVGRQSGGQHNIEEPAPITILFDRAQRRFAVIDHAEGLTDQEMKERFVMYGAESSDRSRGYRTRSLFGKGLRDVLFTQRHGQVKSIKDGQFYNSRFRWKEIDSQERPVVEIKAPSRITAELRRALDIPGNGTLVEFNLAEGVHKPQPEKLIERLSRFYMLRMINSSPHREVVLKALGRGGRSTGEAQLSYRFPQIEVVDRFEEEIQPDDSMVIHIRGEIGLCDREMTQGEVGYEDREGGLLVLDEDGAVLDLCLFGFDEDPNARRISGTLQLIGAGAFIRKKLNEPHPEEILTETREGLDKNHAFYRLLRDRIQPRLVPIVATLREQGTQQRPTLSDRTRERHKQALDLLSQLYNEMLGRTRPGGNIPTALRLPPQDGIAFVNTHVTVQAGLWTPVPLLINTALVRSDDIGLTTRS